MKKALLLLGLATACTRGTEPTERPRPESRSHNTLVSDSLSELSTDSSSLPITPAQRADYIREMERLTQATANAEPAWSRDGRDSAYTVIALTDQVRFVRRVNQCLDQGYYLRGPLRTERTGPGSFVYLQDLVCHRAHVQDERRGLTMGASTGQKTRDR